MMFGYAVNETDNYMPLALDLSHKLLEELSQIRKEGNEITYLRPDSKSQVTVEYKNGLPQRIDTIVLSTQHDEFDDDIPMLKKIESDIKEVLIPRIISKYPNYSKYFNDNIIYHVNPTGKFVIGGPHGDTGLTGRKIIVDTYGGKGGSRRRHSQAKTLVKSTGVRHMQPEILQKISVLQVLQKRY